MAQFTVEVPDELLPGLVAEISSFPEGVSPEEYFTKSVVELFRQRCEIYKVGPYYEGPIMPKFNADGTLFAQTDSVSGIDTGITEDTLGK